jgi:uncharacterized protein (TIGR02597 family)
MTRRITILVAAIFAMAMVARGQTTATTDPVGFTSVTVGAGKIAALGLPLDNLSDYVGAAAAVTSNTIQISSATWTTDAYAPFASNPHVIRLLSGASKGRQYRVASNTTDTLTLTTGSIDLTTGVASGDRFEILPVTTLQSLFGATAPSLLTNADSNVADNVLLRGSFGWLTYYNDGTQWLRQGGGSTVQNTTAISPEQGLLFVRRSTSPLTFTVTGAVPMTNQKTDFAASKITAFGNRFPVDVTLAALGLGQLPGWVASSDSTAADNVLVRGSFGWLTYYYDGANWLREGNGGTTQNQTNIPTGTAMLIVRRGSTDVTADQPLPY